MTKAELIKHAIELDANAKLLLKSDKSHRPIPENMIQIFNSVLTELKHKAPHDTVISGIEELLGPIKPRNFIGSAGALKAAAESLDNNPNLE